MLILQRNIISQVWAWRIMMSLSNIWKSIKYRHFMILLSNGFILLLYTLRRILALCVYVSVGLTFSLLFTTCLGFLSRELNLKQGRLAVWE